MSDLHHRSTLDDAFHEWLLSDHPAPRTGPAGGEVRVIPAPRPAPDAHYQVTPEVVALVDQLEAAWSAKREAAPQVAVGFPEPEAGS